MTLLVLLFLAHSPHGHPSHHKIPCWMVKTYISAAGENAARSLGKQNGYSEAEIEAVRLRCLPAAHTTGAK